MAATCVSYAFYDRTRQFQAQENISNKKDLEKTLNCQKIELFLKGKLHPKIPLLHMKVLTLFITKIYVFL